MSRLGLSRQLRTLDGFIPRSRHIVTNPGECLIETRSVSIKAAKAAGWFRRLG